MTEEQFERFVVAQERQAEHLGEICNVLKGIACMTYSPNEVDRNGEPANVIDALFAIARAVRSPRA